MWKTWAKAQTVPTCSNQSDTCVKKSLRQRIFIKSLAFGGSNNVARPDGWSRLGCKNSAALDWGEPFQLDRQLELHIGYFCLSCIEHIQCLWSALDPWSVGQVWPGSSSNAIESAEVKTSEKVDCPSQFTNLANSKCHIVPWSHMIPLYLSVFPILLIQLEVDRCICWSS